MYHLINPEVFLLDFDQMQLISFLKPTKILCKTCHCHLTLFVLGQTAILWIRGRQMDNPNEKEDVNGLPR